MADETNKQATSSSDVGLGQEVNQRSNDTEGTTVEVHDGFLIHETRMHGVRIGQVSGQYLITNSHDDPHTFRLVQSVGGTPNIGNSIVLRIQILEEPLTAQSLSTTITVITDLYTRCWLIQQKRFADLMDYTQSHDPRIVREANLRVGAMSHNSPTIIDFLIGSGGIAGAASLVLTLKIGIDAIAQTPLRFKATKLKNEKEALEQKIREQKEKQDQEIAAQKATTEDKAKQQEIQLAAQQAQLDLEKQQLELDRQRFELQKDRVSVVIEIAKTMVNELQPEIASGEKEMIIHSLVPPLLQLAATDAIVTVIQPTQASDEDEGDYKEM